MVNKYQHYSTSWMQPMENVGGLDATFELWADYFSYKHVHVIISSPQL